MRGRWRVGSVGKLVGGRLALDVHAAMHGNTGMPLEGCLPGRAQAAGDLGAAHLGDASRLQSVVAVLISPPPAAVQELGLDEDEEGDVGSHWLDVLHVLPMLRKYSKALRKQFLRYTQPLWCLAL